MFFKIGAVSQTVLLRSGQEPFRCKPASFLHPWPVAHLEYIHKSWNRCPV